MSFHLSELSTNSVNSTQQVNQNTQSSQSKDPSENLTKTMMKQMKANEKFDIELEDIGFYQADKILDEINFLSAKVCGYSRSSGATDFSSRNSEGNDEINGCNFHPIPLSPKRITTNNLSKSILGTSQFDGPHIYPQVDLSSTQSIDDDFRQSYQYFRTTPPRRPRKL